MSCTSDIQELRLFSVLGVGGYHLLTYHLVYLSQRLVEEVTSHLSSYLCHHVVHARDPHVAKHHDLVVPWQEPVVTSHVGQHPLDRELVIQEVLFLPAVFPELVEMPLILQMVSNGIQVGLKTIVKDE